LTKSGNDADDREIYNEGSKAAEQKGAKRLKLRCIGGQGDRQKKRILMQEGVSTGREASKEEPWEKVGAGPA